MQGVRVRQGLRGAHIGTSRRAARQSASRQSRGTSYSISCQSNRYDDRDDRDSQQRQRNSSSSSSIREAPEVKRTGLQHPRSVKCCDLLSPLLSGFLDNHSSCWFVPCCRDGIVEGTRPMHACMFRRSTYNPGCRANGPLPSPSTMNLKLAIPRSYCRYSQAN